MISTDVYFGSLNSRTDLGLVFTHAAIGAPETHTEYVDVPGKGPVDLSELVVGEPWYLTRELVVEFEYLAADWAAERTLVYGNIHGKKLQIRFLNDPNWVYFGRCAVETEVNLSTLHFIVTITAEPFKEAFPAVEDKLTTSGSTVMNPTLFPSLPLLHVIGSGAGTVTVGNQIITLSNIDGYVDIDSKLMDCYKGLVNCNSDVVLDEFPKLKPGTTAISWTGGVTAVWVTGRWRTL